MEDRELSPWDLPGYSACACGDEPISWGWAAMWVLWGLTVGGLIMWADGAYAVAGCFVAWGLLMGFFGFRALGVGSAIVNDWAVAHFSDRELELAATSEIFEAFDAARERHDFDEENFEVPDTLAQRRQSQQELFALLVSIPWFMGLVHGTGVGGLVGALLALIPSLETSVTSAAITGAVGGAVLAACLAAAIFALVPLPKDTLPIPFSLRQRLLVLVSPLLVMPALVEAAVMWGRWYWRGRFDSQSVGG